VTGFFWFVCLSLFGYILFWIFLSFSWSRDLFLVAVMVVFRKEIHQRAKPGLLGIDATHRLTHQEGFGKKGLLSHDHFRRCQVGIIVIAQHVRHFKNAVPSLNYVPWWRKDQAQRVYPPTETNVQNSTLSNPTDIIESLQIPIQPK